MTRLWMAAAAALVLLAGPALAEDVVPANRAEIDLTFAPLVRTAAPAVVNIYARHMVVERQNPLFDDPFFQRFFGDDIPGGRPRQRMENSLGSGVVVAADGLVVTNHHVIKDADQITVVLADRTEFEMDPGTVDPRIPRVNDFLVVKGKPRQIMFSDPIAVNGVVVRVSRQRRAGMDRRQGEGFVGH